MLALNIAEPLLNIKSNKIKEILQGLTKEQLEEINYKWNYVSVMNHDQIEIVKKKINSFAEFFYSIYKEVIFMLI